MPAKFPYAAFLPMFATVALMFALGQAQRSSGGVISAALSSELGLAGALLGVVMSAMFIGAAVAQLPIGVLLDRFGPRRVAPPITLVGAVGCILFATSDTPLVLAVGRALIGFGFSVAWASAFVISSRWISGERFALATSAVAVTGALASLLATAPLAVAIDLWGRQAIFLGLAGITALFAMVSAATVRDAPPGEPAPGEVAPGEAAESVRESILGIAAVLRLSHFRRLAPVAFIMFSPTMILVGLWAGPFLRDLYGLDNAARGGVLFAMMGAVTAGILAYGPLDRIFNTRKWVVVGGGGGIIATSLALALLPAPGLAVATALLMAISFFGPLYAVFLTHCRALFPAYLMARAMTVMSLLGILGVVLLQVGFGLILDPFTDAAGMASSTGYRIGFAAYAAVVASAMLIYSRVQDAPPRPRAAPPPP